MGPPNSRNGGGGGGGRVGNESPTTPRPPAHGTARGGAAAAATASSPCPSASSSAHSPARSGVLHHRPPISPYPSPAAAAAHVTAAPAAARTPTQAQIQQALLVDENRGGLLRPPPPLPTLSGGGGGSGPSPPHAHNQHHHQQQHQGRTAQSSGKRRRRATALCLAVALLIGAQYLYAAAVASTNDAAAATTSAAASASAAATTTATRGGGDRSSGAGGGAAATGGDVSGSNGAVSDATNGGTTKKDAVAAAASAPPTTMAAAGRHRRGLPIELGQQSAHGKASRSHPRGERGRYYHPRVYYVRSGKGDESDGGGGSDSNSLGDEEDVNTDGKKSQRRRRHGKSKKYDRRTTRSVELYPADYSDETQLYPEADSADPPFNETMKLRRFPPPSEDDDGDNNDNDGDGGGGRCRPMADWQVTSRPTCNLFHELDAGDDLRHDGRLALLGSGNWRDAWMLKQPREAGGALEALPSGGSSDAPVVIKTWRYMHRVEDEYFELNRVDAVAMERLTASPYVINVHGFCGLSIATEHATETLTAVADKLDGLSKLRLVKQIAEGLADVHGIDRGDNGRRGAASLVHNDLNTAHIMMTNDGIPRLNDFNVARLMLWDRLKQRPCGFTADHWNPQWRSPEEIRSLRGLEHEPLTEGVDIYALGNVIYRFVTGGRAWYKGHGSMTEEYEDEIARWKILGRIPSVPEKFRREKDAAIKALLGVMKRCYHFDPAKRPTARDVVRALEKTIVEIEGGKAKEKN